MVSMFALITEDDWFEPSLSQNKHYKIGDRISGVMVNVLASSVLDHGFQPGRVLPKNIKLVFVASLLSTQH
jgi:hypothetical protein